MATVTGDHDGPERCPECGAGLVEVFDTLTKATELQCSECDWVGDQVDEQDEDAGLKEERQI